jgi:hypothetical protein
VHDARKDTWRPELIVKKFLAWKISFTFPTEDNTRMTSRLFKTLSLIALIALFAFGQMAFAAENHTKYHIRLVPRSHSGMVASPDATSPTANLYALTAAFVGDPFVVAQTPTNSDGTDLWPCFGSWTSAGGDTSENPDCPTVGDPSQPLPEGADVLGNPSYAFTLSACNATSTSANFCGQTNTFYEDWTGDTSDYLIYSIEAEQGSSIIADSGTVVFGPNTFAGTPGVDVVIYGDQNFGTEGETGKNNGNCIPNEGYPVTSTTFPGIYVISADKTCDAAKAGAVTITATTEVATPTFTQESAKTCEADGVTSPCYEVKFTKKYDISQKWTIFLTSTAD